MNKKQLALHLGWIGAALVAVTGFAFELPEPMVWTLAITTLTAVWWITEAIPIPATSLVPFALFPMAGVLDHKAVSSALGNHVILLLMGAFMLSKAIEKNRVHERLALYMIRVTGGDSAIRLMLGFMLASALLSMWISNTATTLMLLPIAMAIIAKTDNKKFACMLLLGIAYSASLGGVGTPVGTPPNVIFMSVYQEATGQEYSFLQWMKTGVPVVLIGIPLMALWLSRGVKLNETVVIPECGKWQKAEVRVMIIFALTAIAWMTRKEPFGGWQALFGIELAGDSTVALLAVLLMFVVPSGNKPQEKLLDWQTAVSIPWGMLLLFAGGIAIAKAFVASGLSQALGDSLAGMNHLPIWVLIGVICIAVTFLTEITSNTATATLLMPILATAAISADIAPELLMIPAAISASCAFMLPVATAPNAVVYSSGQMTMQDMMKAGFTLNLMVAVIATMIVTWTLT